MSPRSEELIEFAREALLGARGARDVGARARAASSAYYSMLYAARAALSEEDRSARTHRGTWHMFRKRFVDEGRFPARLAAEAQEAQSVREASDYEASAPSSEELTSILATAERFLVAVEEMLRG